MKVYKETEISFYYRHSDTYQYFPKNVLSTIFLIIYILIYSLHLLPIFQQKIFFLLEYIPWVRPNFSSINSIFCKNTTNKPSSYRTA